ncbi:hypothetical protein CMO95_01190, partial [Candidatus Woesearchaeota archaeon]|nr:hypothetical protein [Candidatus Woesearchaeota archaeon]
LLKILDQENIKHTDEDIINIVNQFYPDLRKCINTIQANTVDSQLKLDKSVLFSSNYVDKVINELGKDKPSFKQIRQIIADANTDDYEELFRELFDSASEYLPGKEGTVAGLVNDHQYKANFRIDKEINVMSLINNIINNK